MKFIEVTQEGALAPVLLNVAEIDFVDATSVGSRICGRNIQVRVNESYETVRNMIYGATDDPRFVRPTGGSKATMKTGAL